MTRPHRGERPLVIGVGNRDRGDDGVGPIVAESVGARCREAVSTMVAEGDLSDLALRWTTSQDVVVVDAMSSGRAPGTVIRIDALTQPPSTQRGLLSSHGIGLADAIELGRLLGRLPRTLTIWAVEATAFEQFEPMSPAVAAAIPRLVDHIADHISGGAADHISGDIADERPDPADQADGPVRQASIETRSASASTSRASQS